MPARIALALAVMSMAGCAAGSEDVQSPAGGRPTPLAITVDDLPAHGPLPPGKTRLDIAQEMIAALEAEQVPAIGFVNGSFGVKDPDAPLVLKAWRDAGFALGNHTYSHSHLDEIGAKAFLADLDRNEVYLTDEPKRLRFPYLEEGKDPALRDDVRSGLAERGYRIAAVTLSFDDYAYNEPYVRCLKQGNEEAIAALEKRYLDSARRDAERIRAISRKTQGSDVPQVLLLHIGAFSAKMLPRLLDQYRAMGYSFASLDEVQKAPLYASTDPAKPGPTPDLNRLSGKVSPPLPPKLPLPDSKICPAR